MRSSWCGCWVTGPARRAVGQSLRVQLEKWAARAGRDLALAAAIHELVTTGPLVVKMLLRDGVILCCFQVRAQPGCRESTTAYLLKGVEGGCDYRERVNNEPLPKTSTKTSLQTHATLFALAPMGGKQSLTNRFGNAESSKQLYIIGRLNTG